VFKRRKPDEPLAAVPPATVPQVPVAGSSSRQESAAPGSPPADTGLGVPPFRPVPSQEAPLMARTPFSSAPPPPGGPAATPGIPALPPRPPVAPASVGPRPAGAPAERRTLVVGRGISVQGTVQDAERLVVEGTVEASLIHATELAISPGGVFKGEVEVEEAEIAGTIDGTLTARGALVVRATGRVLGTARCRRLQVEDGGQITGRIEMLTEGAGRVESPRAEPHRVEPFRTEPPRTPTEAASSG
jgi:cytoskeletal protein CcmA (bactofilin family)